jgi:MFS family permease
VFGILGMMISLASLVGGLTFGRMADAWGYGGMAEAAAVFEAIVPLTALLAVPGAGSPIPKQAAGAPVRVRWVGAALLLLLGSEILAMTVAGSGNMGRSLLMNEKAFSGAAITSTAAIAGIVSLPLPFILGWLSDRVGRRGVMIGSFVAGIAALLLLPVSRSLWLFSAATALLSVHAVSMTLGPAFVVDIVPAEKVGAGVSLFQSAAWVGTIAGYIYSGVAFPRLGIIPALLAGAVFPVAAIPVLLLIRTAARTPVPRGVSAGKPGSSAAEAGPIS